MQVICAAADKVTKHLSEGELSLRKIFLKSWNKRIHVLILCAILYFRRWMSPLLLLLDLYQKLAVASQRKSQLNKLLVSEHFYTSFKKKTIRMWFSVKH